MAPDPNQNVAKEAPDMERWMRQGKAESRFQNNPPSSENMGVSKNRGTPKSSNLIRCSIINHPFWGTIIFGNTHMNNRNQDSVIHQKKNIRL